MEADGIAVAGEAVTIQKAIDAFKADTKNNVEPSTLKQYRILLSRLSSFCESHGYVFLKQLGVVEVREFRGSWTTYSPRTASKHIERLKRFFNWCVENGWLTVSPAKPLKPPKVSETDVVPFTEEEVGKIMNACESYEGPNKPRLIVLTNLMLATGLRISDAVTVSKDKFVHSKDGWMMELRTAKTGTAVACPIQDGLAKAVLKLSGEHPFWTGNSDLEDRTKNWRKIYTTVFKTAGVKGTPHMLRHCAAKRLLVAGVPISHVATLLGNTEQVCRKSYAKWIPERQKALNEAIKKAWTS
jgi:site-specific recombinase XerD